MLNFQYSQFRIRLASHAIRELLSALQHSAMIFCASAGIGLLGLLAFIALPLFYAPLLAWPKALAMVLGQSVLMALPVLLLKTTILPVHVRPWLRALPISRLDLWAANTLVCGRWIAILAGFYAVSAAIWLWQFPPWLQPVWYWGLLNVCVLLLISWVLGTLILQFEYQPKPKPKALAVASALRLAARWQGWRLAWPLLVLPFFRAGKIHIALRQILLLCLSVSTLAAWFYHQQLQIAGALLALLFSVSFVLLISLGDAALKHQYRHLHPHIQAWPVQAQMIRHSARVLAALPLLLVLGLFLLLAVQNEALISLRVMWVYCSVALLGHFTMIAFSQLGSQMRAMLLVLTMGILSAAGSELWL
ncbi:MAG: hypothetical protein NT086_01605 [Proteobacteria bacterium]|nr:hypothetical protein [Pseudomonadota bacterium]